MSNDTSHVREYHVHMGSLKLTSSSLCLSPSAKPTSLQCGCKPPSMNPSTSFSAFTMLATIVRMSLATCPYGSSFKLSVASLLNESTASTMMPVLLVGVPHTTAVARFENVCLIKPPSHLMLTN